VPEPLARQMDGALLAIGALSDTLKAKVRMHALAVVVPSPCLTHRQLWAALWECEPQSG